MKIDYGICLSDYCDIFECREYSDKMLKTQVFMDRNTTVEGIVPKRDAVSDPYRYYLMQQLTYETRERLD